MISNTKRILKRYRQEARQEIAEKIWHGVKYILAVLFWFCMCYVLLVLAFSFNVPLDIIN